MTVDVQLCFQWPRTLSAAMGFGTSMHQKRPLRFTHCLTDGSRRSLRHNQTRLVLVWTTAASQAIKLYSQTPYDQPGPPGCAVRPQDTSQGRENTDWLMKDETLPVAAESVVTKAGPNCNCSLRVLNENFLVGSREKCDCWKLACSKRVASGTRTTSPWGQMAHMQGYPRRPCTVTPDT